MEIGTYCKREKEKHSEKKIKERKRKRGDTASWIERERATE